MEITKICPVCGKEFTYTMKSGGGWNRIYCNAACARKKDTSNTYKRVSDNSHKGYLAAELIMRYNGRCAICGWRASEALITTDGRTQKAYGNEIHHIIPVKNGGRATEDNLILLCPNHHKQADLGVLTADDLRAYILPPKSLQEKQRMKNACVDVIAAQIFG